ncbi:hypothetical protein DFH06DRAFT_475661 [Mycena polygramma]|nr:hypothetical protein DFH06DRAFT_475661 [Mycena polygramma]
MTVEQAPVRFGLGSFITAEVTFLFGSAFPSSPLLALEVGGRQNQQDLIAVAAPALHQMFICFFSLCSISSINSFSSAR